MTKIIQGGQPYTPQIVRVYNQLGDITVTGCAMNGFEHVAQTGLGPLLRGGFLQGTIQCSRRILLNNIAVWTDNQGGIRFKTNGFRRLKSNKYNVKKEQEKQVQKDLPAAIDKMPYPQSKFNRERTFVSHAVACIKFVGTIV